MEKLTKKKFKLVRLFLLYFSITLVAPFSFAEWSGFFKSQVYKNTGVNGSYLRQNGRVQNIFDLSNGKKLEFAYDLAWLRTESELDVDGSNDRFRFVDFVRVPENTSTNLVVQNLDRLSFYWELSKIQIILGRQPISFGSAKTINPTDVFAPFEVAAIDTENRIGVDAIRGRIPISDFSEVDAGVVFGKDASDEKNAYFANLKWSKQDLELQIGWNHFLQNTLYSIDLQTVLLQQAVWLELANYFPRDENSFYIFSTGMDYRYNEDLYFFFEFHQNELGAKQTSQYSARSELPIFKDANILFLSYNYLNLGGVYQIHPLWTLSGSLFNNFQDGSKLLSSKIEWNVSEDWYIDFGTVLGISRSSDSEFSKYKETFFGALRLYL